MQVLLECKQSQIALAKDESYGSFVVLKSHDSLAGFKFYQLGKMAEPTINENEVKSLEALPALLSVVLLFWDMAKAASGGAPQDFFWPTELHRDFAISQSQ